MNAEPIAGRRIPHAYRSNARSPSCLCRRRKKCERPPGPSLPPPGARAIDRGVNLSDPAWRMPPVRTAVRVAKSLIRRRLPSLHEVVVPYDEDRSVIVADLHTALGLMLYRYGVRDADVALVGRLLRAGDVFIDGGANVGLFTLVAARAVGPTGRVVAFEPSPKSREVLRRNVALNGFHWTVVRSEALDAGTGVRHFVARDGDAAGLSSFAPRDAAPSEETQVVETTSLDEATADIDRSRGGGREARSRRGGARCAPGEPRSSP